MQEPHNSLPSPGATSVVTGDLQSVPVGATAHQAAGRIKARTDSMSANLRTGHHGMHAVNCAFASNSQGQGIRATQSPTIKRSRLIRLDSRLGPADCLAVSR